MTLTAWLSTTDRINQRLPPHDVWSDDRWVGDDRDASCSNSSSSRVSVALAGVSDRNDGRDNSCIEAADAVGAANGEL